MSDAKTFYRCKLCGREFGSLSAWYNHLIRLHSESEPEWSRALRLEGRKPPLWKVLQDAEAAGLVERFKAKACCGRCLYYDFAALKCRKRPQIVVLSPVNTAVCPDFTWAEVPNEVAVEMIRLDGLDGVQRTRRQRRHAARKQPCEALARWGERGG
jgi:hypothetical protein